MPEGDTIHRTAITPSRGLARRQDHECCELQAIPDTSGCRRSGVHKDRSSREASAYSFERLSHDSLAHGNDRVVVLVRCERNEEEKIGNGTRSNGESE